MSANPENPMKLVLEAVPKIVEVLTPLSSEERQRAIAAAMLLFGEPAPNIGSAKAPSRDQYPAAEDGISGKALAWMKKNSITREQLDHVFCIENGAIDVIASKMPTFGKRQQTVQAYIICGLKSFLKTGEPTFSDDEGRELCSRVGCYDVANHSNYRKALGNFISGSKESGWRLSNPGLSEGAKIVKQLAPETTT
ncbi:MAG TPA: hypothetical protein VNN22_26535 [Verrucomicrobiae bacterium]|nr:hypothetical protein [Verrucomicrobiae bacterium]